MGALKGRAAKHIEIALAIPALVLHDRFAPTVMYSIVQAPARATTQLTPVKVLDQMRVATIFIQQIVYRVVHP